MKFAPGPTGTGRVLLDGAVLAVPAEHLRSLAALLSHLELTALRRQRVLATLSIDDVPVQISDSLPGPGRWSEIKATSISFGHLSRRLIDSAAANLNVLRDEVEQAVLSVMINEPRSLQRVWRRWHPDVRNTLAVFNLLRQLWHAERFDQWIHPEEVRRLCDEIDHIVCDAQLAFLHPPGPDPTDASLALSELLEHGLIPWLDHTRQLLTQLHENIQDD